MGYCHTILLARRNMKLPGSTHIHLLIVFIEGEFLLHEPGRQR